jgi:hypothetical protein
VTWGAFRFSYTQFGLIAVVVFLAPETLPLLEIKEPLTNTQRLGCDLQQLVFVDVVEKLVEGKLGRRVDLRGDL